ncbi:MAG: TlpA disulfide reductase family protein [Verrucomicrobiia bacterium]|jgi:thiol-disulfide isomerase/thioredoxin
MKRTRVSWFVSALFLTASAIPLLAADPTLTIGDRAPALQTGQWVQGEPVKQFEKGKAYIIEFWATWCGPCRASIPHLNETANKYKDKGLVVIGQNCWERDESLVAPFIKKMGDKMTYRVALDDKRGNDKGKMADTWMEAAGQDGIPTAFVVNTDGVVAWIGHPMELDEKLVEGVLAGKFDIKQAAVEFDKKQKEAAETRKVFAQVKADLARFKDLMSKKDYGGAYTLAGELSDGHQDNAWLQNEIAWRIATEKGVDESGVALAEKIARRADGAAKGQDEGTLDTLARIFFLQGRKTEAIDLETRAVGLASGEMKDKLQDVLASYKKGVLPSGDY